MSRDGLNIGFFTDTYLPQINGVTYSLRNWKAELEGRGNDVTVVYPDSSHVPEEGERPVPSMGVRFVDNYRVLLGSAGDVAATLDDLDVVHAHSQFTAGLIGRKIAQKHDARFVASYHTPLRKYFDYLPPHPVPERVLERVYTFWERRFYRSADTVVAPSRTAADHVAGIIGRDVVSLSNGIDTEFFSPDAPGMREELGIPADERVIGYCGRLGFEKRLDDLVDLAPRFDGTILVAGDGFARDHYLERFEPHDNIRYVGRLDRAEMPRFYRTLDMFVMPSVAETQGVSLLEANACGAPAVGADAMALSETIQEGRNGYLYPPGDIDALARQVDTAFDEHDDLREGAVAVAAENSVESVVDDLLAIYTDGSGRAMMSTERRDA